MAGDRPSRPRAEPVRTSLLDDNWDDDRASNTAVALPEGMLPLDEDEETIDRRNLPASPAQPRRPPAPPELPDVDESSVTEVDRRLVDDVVDEDAVATLATVRLSDIDPMLGLPSPAASPHDPVPEPPVEPAAPSPAATDDVRAQPVESAYGVLQPPAESHEAPPPVAPGAPPATAPGASVRPATDAVLRESPVSAGAGPRAQFPTPARGMPTWLSLTLMVLTLAAGVAVGFVLGRARQKAAQSARAPATATPAPIASAMPRAAASSLVDRASAGDSAAMKQLQARPRPDVNALLALSHGRVMQRRHKVEQLGDQLLHKPSLASDHGVEKKLLLAARDPTTVRQALGIMATLPGSTGPDLLFRVWTGTRRRTEATRLAEQLVYERNVRARATPALAVALDLRKAENCKDNQKLLAPAKDHGDRRSLHALLLLRRHHGCGRHRRQDCFKCLRGNHDLRDAIKAVRHRHGPKL